MTAATSTLTRENGNLPAQTRASVGKVAIGVASQMGPLHPTSASRRSAACAEVRIWFPRMLAEAWNIGVGSLFIVLLISGFAGAVTALQTGYQFTGSIPYYVVGTLVVASIILELGPVLTALILAGRIGARYAAELGTMRVTEQIDALESLGRSPSSHLIMPRVLAGAHHDPGAHHLRQRDRHPGGLVVGEAGAPGHQRGLHLRRAATTSARSTPGTR